MLRKLQRGEKLSLPHSRPMPAIGARVHELRVTDENRIWRIIYKLERAAVLIVHVFEKKTTRTPKTVIEKCKARLELYSHATKRT